jgi:hypothetical protein
MENAFLAGPFCVRAVPIVPWESERMHMRLLAYCLDTPLYSSEAKDFGRITSAGAAELSASR